MRNLFVKSGSPLRGFFPLVRKTRHWAWKYHDRMAQRLVISGGEVRFMDAVLSFPESVGLTYSTPLFWNGPEAYEGPTSRTLATLIGHSRSFLDVGSNIGIYTVYAGVRHPQVMTYAFEPVPHIWKKNCTFQRANRLSEKNVLNIALSDQVGVQTIFLPVYTAGLEEEQTATLRADSWQANEPVVEKFEVRCETLDSFVAANPLPKGRCCLKIDVENHEAAVLRGGRSFLTHHLPWIVCEILPREAHETSSDEKCKANQITAGLIEELGYAAFAIIGEGYFRMTRADFTQPRRMKDFLLIPRKQVAGDAGYLSAETLSGLFTAA
jgi:FkbM family methyltransferase